MHSNVASVLGRYANAYVSCYSKTDYERLLSFGAPREKLSFIRFGKHTSSEWRGNLPVGYMSGNSIHRRGVGCGFSLLEQLIQAKTPILLSGKDTQELPYGLGEISFEAMKNMYRTCRCYVSMGTTPAPYVLTLTEALCCGMPVVAYNNGSGIDREGIDVIVCNSVIDMYHEIMRLIDDNSYACERSRKSVETAKQFEINHVAKQWDDFISTMRSAT